MRSFDFGPDKLNNLRNIIKRIAEQHHYEDQSGAAFDVRVQFMSKNSRRNHQTSVVDVVASFSTGRGWSQHS